MTQGRALKKFNPLEIEEEHVLAVATGRENLLATMMAEMRICLQPDANQHYMLFGPRGIGKSFFIRLLKITHDRSEKFEHSEFLQLPEELDNISYVADILDIISNKLEGGYLADSKPKWEMNDHLWATANNRLKKALQNYRKEKNKDHVFVSLENLQDFIPSLGDIENGRLRAFMSDFTDITIIGSSLRPNLDNDYTKKLFQVFKKIDLEPWEEEDFLAFYRRKAEIGSNREEQLRRLEGSRHKIRAIANFTGGSPRLAVILSGLVLDQNILDTAELLDGIIDDLTTYYQNLTADIPHKSKLLFDMLIRNGENVSQSQLAQSFDPPQEQRNIARSFNWLLDNYYVTFKKGARGNLKLYYVRDRLYVFYYQKRQVFADRVFSFIGTLVDFLFEYYTHEERKDQLETLDLNRPMSKVIMQCYSDKLGHKMVNTLGAEQMRRSLLSQLESTKTGIQLDSEEEDLEITKIKEVQEQKRTAKQWLDLGSWNYRNNHIDQAIYDLEKAIDLDPMDARAYNLLGITLRDNGNLDGAIIHFKKAIDLNQKGVRAYIGLGVALRIKGDLVGANTQFKKAVDLDPSNTNAHINLGFILGEKGDLVEAITQFKKAIDLDPKNVYAYTLLGIALGSKGDLHGAITQIRKAIDLDPKNAYAYNLLGEFLREKGDLHGAITQIRKAIELDPKNAYAYNLLGITLGSKGDLEKAITSFNKAIDLDPKNSGAFFNLGIALEDKGDLDGAITQFKKAIELDPKSVRAYNLLGIALRDNGDLQGAITEFKKATDLHPEDVHAYNFLGIALKSKGELDNAIIQFNKAVTLHPKDVSAYNFLGIALRDKGDLDGAITQFEKAIELDPINTYAYINLGITLRDKGDLDGAITQFNETITQFPLDESVLNNLFELFIIHNMWGAIDAYSVEMPENITKPLLIGRALGNITNNNNNIEHFQLFKSTTEYIQSRHPEWFVNFITTLTIRLYISGNKKSLSTLIDELKVIEKNDPFIQIIVDCWKYLLDPDNVDLSMLHPDARIVVNAVLNS